ncbi:putative glycine cleavage system H protein, mitochondrial precursor [Microstroma glucosiphilum]|uniref:Glycine cleavage system H protein n=1 Tax=Pseudomicrostroma glucosiphilum TaxID=1684307 RepID=A0A316U3J9_9BASI|nr:putative glycine cleavage system H protein, mitochondrial precursor [Pseudomicrostroma glucosiphilum]PWN19882.1 putative glycine cleavage system H protein, mitochondrial precursor [Pseudomicrostroma glucosiphilum]
MLSAVLPPLRAIAPTTLRSCPLRAAPIPRAAVRPFSTSSLLREIKTRYTPEHEWVALDTDTNIGTVGITDYAQKSLGDVVYVELPSEGSDVKQGEQIGAVESVKAASDIYSPVAGNVTAVNDKLSSEANLLNKSPEKDGWLCQIRLSNPAEFESLLEKSAYGKLTDDH